MTERSLERPAMKYFLGFAYNVHDSSVTLANEQRVLLVLEAERHFGEKKKRCNQAEMEQLVGLALGYVGASIRDVEGVACTAYRNEHLPERLRHIRWHERAVVDVLGRRFDALVVNHHLAHAAIVHAFPETRDVALDVCDGGGDFDDAHAIYRLRLGTLEKLVNQPIHDAFSTRFYDVVSRYLYGRLMCEGKLMALAALGIPRAEMLEFLRDELTAFHEDPSEVSLEKLRRRFPVERPSQSRMAFDLAASTQRLFEELRLESVAALPAEAPQVLLGGGATLNIAANSRIKAALGPTRELLLPPCCDDTGQSLGALLYLCHEQLQVPLQAELPFLGLGDRFGEAPLEARDASEELASFLAGGGIVFLHRGPSEIGPRALGHRSIIGIPTRANYDLINHRIKQREFYRPLAPIVREDQASDWFEWQGESKYMLHRALAKEQALVLAPGICHYDGSARLQTLAQAEDPFLHRLLGLVGELTGCPMLINTSLNPPGRPILSRLEATQAFAREHRELGVRVFSEAKLWPST